MSSKRSHSKSRLGCGQCKRRRVKCDQTPPQCGNCTKRGIECDYQEYKAAFEGVHLSSSPRSIRPKPSQQTLDLSFMGQMGMGQMQSHSHSHSHSPQSGNSGGLAVAPMVPSSPPPPFTLEDLGLLHYFTLYSSQTLPPFNNESCWDVWQHDVPRLALSNPFLMHAILSFAAAHRATVEPDRRTEDTVNARRHYGQALNGFRNTVRDANPDKAEALLSVGSLVGLLTIPLGLEDEATGEEEDPIGLFISLRQGLSGANGILDMFRNCLQGIAVGRLVEHGWSKQQHEIPTDVDAAVKRLDKLAEKYFAAHSDAKQQVDIAYAIAELRRLFTLTVPRPESYAFILSWVIHIGPSFAALVQARNPVALCILAYWCVPLHNAPHRWYMGDWPRRLIVAIGRAVEDTQWAGGMFWPLHEIGGPGAGPVGGGGGAYQL